MVIDKKRVRAFVDRWAEQGYEKGDTHKFWLQLLDAIGYQHSTEVKFEHRLTNRGFIDVWLRDAGVLIEQKGLHVDLDKAEPRQGQLKTPLAQALDYVEDLPRLEQPRYVVTCNFGTFRVYDRDRFSKSELAANAFEFTLAELVKHPEYLSFILDPANSRLEKERQVSIQAGNLIARLYDEMRKGYLDPDSPESMHALNVLCVRLVFCLYCEDSDLFPKDAFYKYLKDIPAGGIRNQLKRLFIALNTDIADRDQYDLDLQPFPYVNGGLFRDVTEVPNFSEEMKSFLLEEVSAQVDWSQISPTIFGGIFESTLNPETRRTGGMHYTSPENIHRVIDPLFLDDLHTEFNEIRNAVGKTPRATKAALKRFHQKLCSLTFFDPACGSGNFLTETYLCLRKLEDEVLSELTGGQSGLSFAEEESDGSRVSLSQFFGIEINDFAVTVAETALWISRLKANGETAMLYDLASKDFPLVDRPNIVLGNALQVDWEGVLPASRCSFVMGNPPFIGYSNHSAEQKAERAAIFGKTGGVLDYVACWYKKAADYIAEYPICCAFVSTNSICQGQQVEPLWKPLFDSGIVINFAHQSFVWASEAAGTAHVHVVIVGFSRQDSKRYLFADGEKHEVETINAYLAAAPNAFVSRRTKPIVAVPELQAGGKPTDGGNLLMWEAEREELVNNEPASEKWIRPFSMGEEFLKGKPRYCLWLVDVTEDEIAAMPLVAERVSGVRKARELSTKAATQKKAATPWLFDEVRPPRGDFIAIPAVSSERRKYVPMKFVENGMIPGNKLFFMEEATLYDFGILMSQTHNAWMRVVAGRLKSDYNYSNTIVYNNFIWPDPSLQQRDLITSCAKAVLDARAAHPELNLAKLYDPELMPDDLRSAHDELDKAVEAAYGIDSGGDESLIVSHLFGLYAAATAKN